MEKVLDYPMSSTEVGVAVGLTEQRIRQLAAEQLCELGLAIRVGRDWRYKAEVIDFIKSR